MDIEYVGDLVRFSKCGFVHVSKRTYDNKMSDGDLSSKPVMWYDSDPLDTVSGALFILIFVCSIIGNVLLLWVLFAYESFKNVTNLFVLNLACSDLVFTVTLPFWAVNYLHHWIFSDFTCKFVTALHFIGLYSSVILLTAITVDRFVTVVLHWPNNPHKRWRCAVLSCAATWVISMGASVIDAIKAQLDTQMNMSMCVDMSESSEINLGYYLQASLLFFLPFAIIVFCYSAILKTVLQTSNRTMHRAVVVVLCIVTAFLVCWGPYNILLFILPQLEPTTQDDLSITITICRILAYAHCCLNPMLYMLSQKLRRHVLHLLRCRNGQRKMRERCAGQSTSLFHNVAAAQNSVVNLELQNATNI